ncbi:PrgI family protein, partial [Dysosmobacter welbionis]
RAANEQAPAPSRGPGPMQWPVYFLPCSAFMRFSWSRMALRIRRLLGVTSSSSSSARNSRHCSRLICLGGTSRSASSEPLARMLVNCFFLQMLTVMSSLRGLTPITIPPYTGTPGPMNRVPRSWALNR